MKDSKWMIVRNSSHRIMRLKERHYIIYLSIVAQRLEQEIIEEFEIPSTPLDVTPLELVSTQKKKRKSSSKGSKREDPKSAPHTIKESRQQNLAREDQIDGSLFEVHSITQVRSF